MDDFGRLLEEQIPRLRRYARVLCHDPERADDLVQDTLCRALGKRHLFVPGSNMRAWLFTILHNLYVNSVRRGMREGRDVPIEDVEPILTEPPPQGGGLTLRDLDRAMDQLSEEQRQAILLVGLESMSYDEVASILDVPVGTVRSRLSRGRDELRQMLDGGAPRPHRRSVPGRGSVLPVTNDRIERIGLSKHRAEEIRFSQPSVSHRLNSFGNGQKPHPITDDERGEVPMGLAFTVLFAEDEAPIRESVAQLLSMGGFRVLKAEDGYEALHLLTQEDVDLLFTDIVMPGLDGIELARRAKRFKPELQIMFMTGYSEKASEAMHLGRVLYKPMRGHQIEAELRSLIRAA
jgi:RNA polymerase sigma-70 factor, ECF subfamily